ncbi:MAG: MinD/ParA family protein [Myxococcales bacterium]|nr:MinD/ParA family protein [Myxococcales bacterium]MCB9521837.1 MinD/ParA family protein [Myxococcales bacterium]
MHTYAITSGKGGVGKTSIVCNLALRLAARGRRVLLMDADLGLANVDIVLGLTPAANLARFFAGEAVLADLLVEAAPNLTVLPAASGVAEMTQLQDTQIQDLSDALDALEADFDVVFVDTGAGIGHNVRRFCAAVSTVLLVVTPEPTSVTDAYATLKVLSQDQGIRQFRLIINQAPDRKGALRVFRQLTEVADRFLDVSLSFAGFVPRDPAVPAAVLERKPFVAVSPDAPAVAAIELLVDELLRDEAHPPTGNLQFFWRRLLGQAS